MTTGSMLACGFTVDGDRTDELISAVERRAAHDDRATATFCVQSVEHAFVDLPSETAAGFPTYTYFFGSDIDQLAICAHNNRGVRY